MRRDLWMVLILGCLLVLLLEAPGALTSVSEDLRGPYETLAAPRPGVATEPTPAANEASEASEPDERGDGAKTDDEEGAARRDSHTLRWFRPAKASLW